MLMSEMTYLRSHHGGRRRLRRWSNTHRTSVRWLCASPSNQTIGYCRPRRDAIPDQAPAYAWLRLQPNGGLRDSPGDQGEAMLCQVYITSSLLYPESHCLPVTTSISTRGYQRRRPCSWRVIRYVCKRLSLIYYDLIHNSPAT